MGCAAPLCAPIGQVARPWFDAELAVLAVALTVLLAVGVTVVIRVRRWRQARAEPPTLAEQLESFQALVEKGELAPNEFERVKARLQQHVAEQQTPPK